MSGALSGWGRVSRAEGPVVDVDEEAGTPKGTGEPHLYHGLGRSYGDVALARDGATIRTPARNRILHIDWDKGIVRAQSGLSISQLLQLCVPQGWFPQVMPGTRFVTLGGAVANDVHGKNHHRTGSFGTSVRALRLVRSDGTAHLCSAEENAPLFHMTIGGLGLTGFIDWVELQLQPIASANMDVENRPFANLDAFYEESERSADWPYTVAWIDCFASGAAMGRGIFTRARHSADAGSLDPGSAEPRVTWPVDLPSAALNKTTVSLFNRLYRARPGARFCGTMHYMPFFFPLDAVARWNRLYGKRGFFQHQSLLPLDAARSGLREQLAAIREAGQGSFLAVLKRYGKERSPGVMSFGGEGYSLALDFANRGQSTLKLLARLEDIAIAHGGRLYAAKDAAMSEASFKSGYPRWRELEDARDPALLSQFWARIVPESLKREPAFNRKMPAYA